MKNNNKTMTTYTGNVAKMVCEAILSSSNKPPYSVEIQGYDHKSSGYWKEGNIYVAYDNTTEDCWVEEFSTKKLAASYAAGVIH